MPAKFKEAEKEWILGMEMKRFRGFLSDSNTALHRGQIVKRSCVDHCSQFLWQKMRTVALTKDGVLPLLCWLVGELGAEGTGTENTSQSHALWQGEGRAALFS